MAKAIKLIAGTPTRITGTLAVAAIVGNSTTKFVRLNTEGISAFLVRIDISSVASDPVFTCHPMLADAGESDLVGTRATTEVPASITLVNGQQRLPVACHGERYWELEIVSDSDDAATIDLIDVYPIAVPVYRGNTEITVLLSAARTATKNSSDQTNHNSGAILIVDVSAITATPTLTPKLQLRDPISGNYIDIWTATTNLTATGTFAYLFGLGGAGSAGDYTEGVNLLLPRTFRFRMVHADADSATYSAVIILLG